MYKFVAARAAAAACLPTTSFCTQFQDESLSPTLYGGNNLVLELSKYSRLGE